MKRKAEPYRNELRPKADLFSFAFPATAATCVTSLAALICAELCVMKLRTIGENNFVQAPCGIAIL